MTNAYIRIAPDGTGKRVDNDLLTIDGEQVYRQRVQVFNGEAIDVSGPLTDAQLRAAPVPTFMTLADGPQISAFGKLNVTSTHTVFDCQNEYGMDTLRIWDAAANGVLATPSTDGSVSSGGNSVGPVDANSRMIPIVVSATDTHYSVLQSRQYCRYVPGKGNVSYITGIFAAGAGATASFTLRSSVSGSVVNSVVQQASWNQDKFDGTGPSGLTVDFTQIQILVIDAQMLYAGRVRVGFDIDGILYWAHYFLIANNQAVPTMQTYNLPVRMEGRTGASTTVFNIGRFDSANGVFFSTTRSTKGGTTYFECCSVQNNGEDELRGFPQAASRGITTVSVTTRRPVMSIRPKTTFNSRTNRAHIEDIEAIINAGSGSVYWELVIDGTLTGASFASVSPNSVAEFDIAATAITGGGTILSGFASGGAVAARGTASQGKDLRNPQVISQIDALTARQIPLSLVCTSFSAGVDITAAMHWFEQIV